MKSDVKIVKEKGVPVAVIVPISKWSEIVKKLENINDISEAQQISSGINSGEDEVFPLEFVRNLVDQTEHPLRLWRKYRRLTLLQVAEKVGVTKSALSMIENGKSAPSVKLLKSLAELLNCDMEDIYSEDSKQHVKK